jgi:ATP-dependent Clp protease ATP-binding subunit ClpX
MGAEAQGAGAVYAASEEAASPNIVNTNGLPEVISTEEELVDTSAIKRAERNLGLFEKELQEVAEKERKKKEGSKFKFDITPRDLYTTLSDYVIGQGEALQMMSNAVCYHYKGLGKRNRKCNALMIGPTGCGKTYVLEKIADILKVPLLIADATKYSATGYVGADVDSMVQELVMKAEGDINKASRGIIYLDEIDKIAAKDGFGRDVSGRDVQNGLLKIIESGDVKVVCNEGPRMLNTKNILFIGGGAFSDLHNILKGSYDINSTEDKDSDYGELLYQASAPDLIEALKKYGMIPELLGRIPMIVRFRQLGKEELVKILKESKDSPINDYITDFKSYGVKMSFAPDSYETIAQIAYDRGMGARGLRSVMEECLAPYKFYLPGAGIKEATIDSASILNANDGLLSLIQKAQGSDTAKTKCEEDTKWLKNNQNQKKNHNKKKSTSQ